MNRNEGPKGLVDALLASDAEKCLEVAVRALDGGTSVRRLLGATVLLPIVSGGDVADVHALATVPPVGRLFAELGEGRERLVPVLWAVANAHAWSRSRRAPVDERVSGRGGMAAVRRRLDLDAATPRGDVHAAIWAAHAPDAAELVGDEWPQVFSSVARTLTRRPPLGLLAPPSVARPIERGSTDGRAIFTELALEAVSARIVEPSDTGPGLHRLTALAALVALFERAHAAERPRILTRAVAFMDHVAAQVPAEGPDLRRVDPTMADPFGWSREEPLEAYCAALGVVTTDRDAFLAAYRDRLARHGQNAHDFKYWAALTDLAEWLPAAREPLLAALAVSRVARTRDEWPRAREARRLLAAG